MKGKSEGKQKKGKIETPIGSRDKNRETRGRENDRKPNINSFSTVIRGNQTQEYRRNVEEGELTNIQAETREYTSAMSQNNSN